MPWPRTALVDCNPPAYHTRLTQTDCRSPWVQEWAKAIAAEFYHQGDTEQRLGLAVSPFMDRRKDEQDFPRGQISFMNYVVVPLFEAAAPLLPNMAFAVVTSPPPTLTHGIVLLGRHHKPTTLLFPRFASVVLS